MTYVEYAFVGVLVLIALVAVVLDATDNVTAAVFLGVVGGPTFVALMLRMGLRREGDDLVVINLLRRHRVPLAEVRGWRYTFLALTAAKGGCVQLVLTNGRRVHARPMREEAAPWLDAQGIPNLSRNDLRHGTRP